MSCGCDYKKAMAELARVRNLAKKTAILTDADQIIYKKPDGTYGFVQENCEYNGEFVEYVINI